MNDLIDVSKVRTNFENIKGFDNGDGTKMWLILTKPRCAKDLAKELRAAGMKNVQVIPNVTKNKKRLL